MSSRDVCNRLYVLEKSNCHDLNELSIGVVITHNPLEVSTRTLQT